MGDRNQDVVGKLLMEWQQGNQAALEQLTPLIYHQLRRLARAYMRSERQGHTLQPTALLNEALARIAGGGNRFNDGKHFYAACASLMRHILVDHAKSRLRTKRGGTLERVPIRAEALDAEAKNDIEIIEIDDALSRLQEAQARPARIFELRYFGGLTIPEIVVVLGVSEATATRDLHFAKAWLLKELHLNK